MRSPELTLPAVRLDYAPTSIYLRSTSEYESRMRGQACAKEPWTVAWIEGLDARAVLWNVGANVGSYALIAGSRGVQTYAVEPHAPSYEALVTNVLINDLSGRVAPLPFALGAATGLQAMRYASLLPGSASHGFGDESGASVPVWVYRGDELAELIPLPTHLLIDVDGAEMEVLSGLIGTLADATGVLIELSRDPALSGACMALLEGVGLELTAQYTERTDGDGNTYEIPDIWYGRYERR